MRAMLATAALLFVTGCATTTPYQNLGFTGGVTVERVGDQWRIHSEVNGFTEPSLARDYFLLRAAEIAKGEGAPAFKVESFNGVVQVVTMNNAAIRHPIVDGVVSLRSEVTGEEDVFDAEQIIATIGSRVRR